MEEPAEPLVDEALTVPCEGIGVWDGARVVHTDGRVGVVVATGELAGQPGAWAAFGAGINSVPEPGFHLARDLRLDLTHRPTRLEALVRLAEARRLPCAHDGVMFYYEPARMVDVRALAIVLRQVFTPPQPPPPQPR